MNVYEKLKFSLIKSITIFSIPNLNIILIFAFTSSVPAYFYLSLVKLTEAFDSARLTLCGPLGITMMLPRTERCVRTTRRKCAFCAKNSW